MLGGMRRAAGQGAKRVARGIVQKSTHARKGVTRQNGKKAGQSIDPIHKTTELFNRELQQALAHQEKELKQAYKEEMKELKLAHKQEMKEMKAQKASIELKFRSERKAKSHYKSLFENANKKIQKLEKTIGNLRQKLDASVASVKEKTKEIAKLTKEITQLENKLDQARKLYKKMIDQQSDEMFKVSKNMANLMKDAPEFLSTAVRVNMTKHREAMDKVQAILKAGNIDKISDASKLPKDKQEQIKILLKKAEVSMEKVLNKIKDSFMEYKEIAPRFLKNGPMRRLINSTLGFADNKVAKAAKMWEWAAKFSLLTYGVSAAFLPPAIQYILGQERYQTLCDTAEQCKNACGHVADSMAKSIAGHKDNAIDKIEGLSDQHEDLSEEHQDLSEEHQDLSEEHQELHEKEGEIKAKAKDTASGKPQSTSRRVVGGNQQANKTEDPKPGS